MFRNSYQSGKSLELLTTQSLDKWKCTGSVKQAYDKSALGYILNIDTQSKGVLQFPKNEKTSLGLLMPFVVFQVFIPTGKPFQCEFRIADNTSNKKRLIFTHGTKAIIKNQLHARIPSSLFKRDIWLNLSINVQEFFESCFPESQFKEIDAISLSACCKCRKIFSMNSPIVDTSQLDDESGIIPEMQSWEKDCEAVPKSNDFKFGVNFMNQLINVSKLDFFLGSTLDDSIMGESLGEDTSTKKSTIQSQKKKIRVGSGNTQLKHRKGLLKNSKNAEDGGQHRNDSKAKNRTRYGSTSPFIQSNVRNRKSKGTAKDEKSTDADEDSKTWGLMGRCIDKRNSTKATNNTNSENGDSPWIGAKGNRSSTEKVKKNTKGDASKGRSQIRKNQKKTIESVDEPPKKKSKFYQFII